ncbi:phospholipid:diacylglycerol acyltransferase [Elasticomyces elasticus]|nr:phospholipid:diacylglycerol acyltransferase [Elasticomyces elasticus]
MAEGQRGGLRRRLGRMISGTPSPSTSGTSTPTGKDGEEVKVVSKAKLDKLQKQKSTKRRSSLYFFLGGLVGLIVALFFLQQNDVIHFDGLSTIGLDGLNNVLPAGIVRELKDLSKAERGVTNSDSFEVGLHLRSQGVRAHHPKEVVGSWTMMRALVLDQASWKKHIMLDKETGLDPPGIKLRAAQGFDATDFFITGYWIWNKILENLASIGYDPTNAFTAAYDWRLAYHHLEVRDQYFTRLKNYIEVAQKTSGLKPVLVSHSMDGQVLFYFMKWVEHKDHGNGGPRWVEDHIDSWINISGSMLGTAKDMPAVLSGEMKDTAQLNAAAVYGTEKFLSREDRVEIFQSWPGLSSMIPKGGTAIWGNMTWAPDDIYANNHTYGPFISFKPPWSSTLTPRQNLTMSQSLDFLLENSQDWYSDMIHQSYSHSIAHTAKEVEINEHRPQAWVNPLEARLPKAPSMKIYCFYGIGKPTERAYLYKEGQSFRQASKDSKINITIDTSFNTGSPPLGTPEVDHGVIFGEGDGTVNILSTGYICSKPWRNIKRYNPSGIKITTREMLHEPDSYSPRGGPNTGDHVDILGRASLNDLILRIAGGKGDEIEDSYKSRIWEIAERVQICDEE